MIEIKTYKPERYSNLIERIWTLENKGDEVEVFTPASQYVNLIFVVNNSKYLYDDLLVESHQVEGISLKNTVAKYPPNTQLVAVRFYAYGLYPFDQTKGNELVNKIIPWRLNNTQIEEIGASSLECPMDVIDKIYTLLESLFNEKEANSISPLIEFYQQFRWNNEIYSIEDYCLQINSNYTSLNRKFSKIVGISPKIFERLIKFRKALCGLTDSNDKLTAIASDSGYFDQAHFIREFKIFINQTPSKYLSLIKQADTDSKIINYNFRLL